MIFSVPWAWLGLLSVPALVAIYFLRQKARRRTVSSLLLWRHELPQHEGGRRLERFEGPPLFWLELLVLLLLVLAAVGPLVATPESRRPLVVVLDDSFSMRAGGDGASPQDRARAALLDELGSERHLTVTLVLAGERPRVLDSGAPESVRLSQALAGWRATAPAAALGEAVGLALELGGPRARLLVLSDHGSPEAVGQPRLAWWAFGRPRPNLAVVQAVRSASEAGSTDDDSCLLEIANYSGRPATARLRLRTDGAELASRPLSLEAEGKARARFRIAAGTTVRAELDEDALAFDNAAVLLPEAARQVRVHNAVGDPALHRVVGESLLATGRARVSSRRAQLVVTDRPPATGETGAAWTLRIRSSPQARPYLGPFVLDRLHPLAEGLSLQGVIWAAAESQADGRPVVSAGDVPLLTDREGDGGHDLELRLRPELSTLQQTPNWPILWWNLLEWRAASAPGLRRANVRLGETVTLTVEEGVETVAWRRPGGEETALSAAGGRLELVAETPGVHELASDRGSERFAVNVLVPGESDLRHAESGRWGGWDDPATGTAWGYRPLSWLFLLLALALLIAHLRWTTVRFPAGRTP